MAFKLKKVPAGMSYDEVRARQAQANAEKSVEPVSEPDVPAVLAEHSDPVLPVPEAEPAELDRTLPEAEPEPSASTPSVTSDRDHDARQAAVPEVAEQPTQESPRHRIEPPEPADRSEIERVIVKGYSAQPARGVSATYDALSPVYGDKAAMKHLLDVALAAFLEALDADEVDRVQIEPIYTSVPKKHQVSRNVPRRIYEVLVEKIDPSGILRPGTIGRTIVQGALNRYIENEQRDKKRT